MGACRPGLNANQDKPTAKTNTCKQQHTQADQNTINQDKSNRATPKCEEQNNKHTQKHTNNTQHTQHTNTYNTRKNAIIKRVNRQTNTATNRPHIINA